MRLFKANYKNLFKMHEQGNIIYIIREAFDTLKQEKKSYLNSLLLARRAVLCNAACRPYICRVVLKIKAID